MIAINLSNLSREISNTDNFKIFPSLMSPYLNSYVRVKNEFLNQTPILRPGGLQTKILDPTSDLDAEK